jgi:Protein of unknown function (DUF3489)
MTARATKTRKIHKRPKAKAIRSSATKRSRAKPDRAPSPIVTVTAGSHQKHPTGKLGHVLDSVSAKRGASLEELVVLTGWQPHTARAALTRLRQRGFEVALRKTGDRKAYHLAEAEPQ